MKTLPSKSPSLVKGPELILRLRFITCERCPHSFRLALVPGLPSDFHLAKVRDFAASGLVDSGALDRRQRLLPVAVLRRERRGLSHAIQLARPDGAVRVRLRLRGDLLDEILEGDPAGERRGKNLPLPSRMISPEPHGPRSPFKINLSLLQDRPSARANATSHELLDFTLARFVRFRLQGMHTTRSNIAWKVDRAELKKRSFYTLRWIEIGARLDCSGHASDVESASSGEAVECKCGHNTCGRSCEKCCPLFNQRPYKIGTHEDANECAQCEVRADSAAHSASRQTDHSLSCVSLVQRPLDRVLLQPGSGPARAERGQARRLQRRRRLPELHRLHGGHKLREVRRRLLPAPRRPPRRQVAVPALRLPRGRVGRLLRRRRRRLHLPRGLHRPQMRQMRRRPRRARLPEMPVRRARNDAGRRMRESLPVQGKLFASNTEN